MKLFLTFLMIFIGRALALSDNKPLFGYYNYNPIKVQMKCSQVIQQVLCAFDFTNDAKEDYYILKRDTPLDGLNSPYLTISQGNNVMKYAGVIAKMAAPTKNDFTFIQAGETITASINLTPSYKFTKDGIYTVEYSRSLVYISSQEMSMISNDEDLLQASHYEDIVDSAEVKVMDSHNLEPTLAEIESAESKSTSSADETVYINDRCAVIEYTEYYPDDGPDGVPFPKKVKCIIKKIHEDMCTKTYGIWKALIYSINAGTHYRKWFGAPSEQNKKTVYGVLRKMYAGLTQRGKVTYSNGGRYCQPNSYSYIIEDSKRIVYFCKLFNELLDFSCGDILYSKFQTIAHELSHKFGEVTDEEVNGVEQYGYDKAEALAKSHPAKAINNAENYGFYIQDVYNEYKGR